MRIFRVFYIKRRLISFFAWVVKDTCISSIYHIYQVCGCTNILKTDFLNYNQCVFTTARRTIHVPSFDECMDTSKTIGGFNIAASWTIFIVK